jgi:hypothetical protein
MSGEKDHLSRRESRWAWFGKLPITEESRCQEHCIHHQGDARLIM